TRPGSRFDWTFDRAPLDRKPVQRQAEVDGVPCTVVEHAQSTGGQAHFYMESQTCVVEPLDGDRWLVRPASQSPMEMHQTAAMAFGGRTPPDPGRGEPARWGIRRQDRVGPVR